VLPDNAVLIALFPNFGTVLAVEAKAVSGPKSDDNRQSEYEDSFHCPGLASAMPCGFILNIEC
jgi:hypothetical protein